MSGTATTAVILCTCSGIITERIDWGEVQRLLADHPRRPVFRVDELACGADNLEALAAWLAEARPGRVVVAACTPREHEVTFRGLMVQAGLDPGFMQLVNVREQAAWVTPDPVQATRKAARLLAGALERVWTHEPLEERRVPVRTDAVVVGAGPAGMQAALTLARAGRTVTVVEREPFIGGLPVRFEELFPALECGPCMLEPLMGDLLHGENHPRLLTQSQLTSVKGGFGNWILTVRQAPRYVTEACIGCMMCVAACPVRRPHPWDPGGERAAVDAPFLGALPNLPFVDPATCLRLQGEPCEACISQCPVPGALDFQEGPREHTLEAGALILATGARELEGVPEPFEGQRDVVAAYTFERMLAMNGPTGGEIRRADGLPPASVAIVQCAGSLGGEVPYCSGTCCRAALKYAHLAAAKLPGTRITRLQREMVAPGLEAGRLLGHDGARGVRYAGPGDLRLSEGPSGRLIHAGGEAVEADLVVLCRPLVPSDGTGEVAALLELARDEAGFLAPLHGTSASCAAPLRGVYLAGSCRGPGDVREAFATGTAAAGLALSELVEGRDLVVESRVAVVDEARCAACRTCVPVCPYKAVTWHADRGVAEVQDLLCRGCGTCVAACPSGAITGRGFSRASLRAELEGVLS